MKNYIFLSLLTMQVMFSQNPEINTQLPTIIPPSPTVSALMKFEEIPVNNYTGIPDISIPLFNTRSLSKDINLDISLKYHPSGIAAEERASDVGLGWSLFAGGTISRTVRGLPDEQLILTAPGGKTGKVGVYNTATLQNHQNNYYYFYDIFLSTPPQSDINEIKNEFLWETAEKGKYDTEHDLWQFNFMGNSGRFYIKKNAATGLLEVEPLDDYRIKIINTYETINNKPFIPTGFTIYDERGYRFEFSDIETSTTSTAVMRSWDNLVPPSQSISGNKFHNSAFQLSKVYDPNNNLIINFLYNQDSIVESYTNHSVKINSNYDGICEYPNCGFSLMDGHSSAICPEGTIANFQKIEPFKTTSSTTSTTNVKKIQSIDVLGVAKIYFTFKKGRQDTNLNFTSNENLSPRALEQILIKNYLSQTIKKYTFEYSYSTVIHKRMILKSIKEYNNNETKFNETNFSYLDNERDGYFINKDYWGYFNFLENCKQFSLFKKEVTPKFTTTDILQKIQYPTKGCTIFDFESNTFSYVGSQEVEVEYELVYSHEEVIEFYGLGVKPISVSNTADRYVRFYPSDTRSNDPEIPNNSINHLVEKINGVWVNVLSLMCPSNQANCCYDYVLKKDKIYGIRRGEFNLGYQMYESEVFEVFIKTPRNYSYGGGNRIKRIGYFDKNTSQTYYQEPASNSLLPVKENFFNYNMNDESTISSGSLVFPKPIFKYDQLHEPCFNCDNIVPQTIGFTTETSFNNLSMIRTHGADVGYKKVSVSETDNGRITYEYTSPIDSPEDIPENYPILKPPFLSSKNLDYKRGLLLNESVFNSSNDTIKKTTYKYNFEEYEKKTGVKIFYDLISCSIGNKFSNYASYKSFLNVVNASPIYSNGTYENIYYSCSCGEPISYISDLPIFEAYGWAKLTNKTTKEYFYPNSSTTPNIMETNETFTYNSLNKKIAETTISNSNNDILKTKYFYHTGNSIHSQNRISEIERIETYRGNELLSKSQINYNNNWTGNVSYLPQAIISAKGNGSFENRLNYLKYDEFGNPLEIQQENGINICYIWGYNKTQPIAKIENANYDAQILQYVANLQNLSNVAEEQTLITALDNLRTALPNAMMTTYTYKPLVGISSITDTKGDRQTYHYNEFNRLEFVKDSQGNILSENKYHYRPQN